MQSACQVLEAVVCYEIESYRRKLEERQRPIWLKTMRGEVHRGCAVHQGGAGDVWCVNRLGAGLAWDVSMGLHGSMGCCVAGAAGDE